MDQRLFIVASSRPDLCEPLRSIFEEMPVEIILDRRQGEGRQRSPADGGERRGADNRTSWVPRSHQVNTAALDRLAEVLAAPLVELVLAGLRAETLQREDLPDLVERVCAKLAGRSLGTPLQRSDITGSAAREEYAQLVVGRVRCALLAAWEQV